ncbi:hypothetical protein PSPHG_CDS_0105 [Pseudomonas phage Psxphi15]
MYDSTAFNNECNPLTKIFPSGIRTPSRRRSLDR